MKMLENLQDDFDFNYKTLKSAGGMSACCCLFFLCCKWCFEIMRKKIMLNRAQNLFYILNKGYTVDTVQNYCDWIGPSHHNESLSSVWFEFAF